MSLTDIDDADPTVDMPVEVPPDVQLLPDPSVLQVGCRYCDETFGITQGWQLARGAHEKKEHRDEWSANRKPSKNGPRGAPAKAPSQKKEPPTRKTSATQSARGGPRRQSAAELLTMAARGVSWLVSTQAAVNPAAGPMATMIAFESPIVGTEGDAAIAGTKFDSVVLQRAMNGKDRFERIGPLLLAPMLVGAAALKPEAYPEIYPMLRYCLAPMLPALVAEMKRQQTEAEQMQAQARELADLDPAFAALFEGGGDPLDAIIARIFPPPASEAGPEPT